MSDTNMIARRSSHEKNYMQGNVNLDDVLEAAMFLANSKTYKKHNITIDTAWLEAAIEILNQMGEENSVTDGVETEIEEGGITENDIPVIEIT